VITISTILGIVLILLQINKQIKLGVITIPKVRMEWKSLPVLARGSSTISTSVPNDDDTADNNVNP
jgi:hypothetical protein